MWLFSVIKDVHFLRVLLMFSMARSAFGGCNSPTGTAELSQDAAVYIYQRLYQDVSASVTNMDFVSTATKYVESLRNPPKEDDLNVDISTNITANPIQNLLFDLFAATEKTRSIYMGYFDKSFISFRVIDGKTLTFYRKSTQEAVSYSFNPRGQARTDEPIGNKAYDCTQRPWYSEGKQKCPKDRNDKLTCGLSWTQPYVDYKNNQMVITATLGIARYHGNAIISSIGGDYLEGGRVIGDELLGVVASDYFFGDMSSILQSIMSEVASEASDVAYLMTSEMGLLAVSDDSKTYECSPDCETEGSEKINILAKNSDNEKISQSALFMEKMNAFSDNTLLMPHGDTQYVLSVREFREFGLDWTIVTVASHNYDKACTLELQSVKLKEAAFAVDELTRQAKVAGNLIKYAFMGQGGALANPSGDRFSIQNWNDINKNNTMSLQNLLKCTAEVFPDIEALFVGFQDDAFIMYKHVGIFFDHFRYQEGYNYGTSESEKTNAKYYYADPLNGYVYECYKYYKLSSYTVTERPWYKFALEKQEPLFSNPYLFADFETIGTTYSVPFYDNNGDVAGVIGIDLTLNLLTEELRSFTSAGNVIFGVETSASGKDRDFNMLASSSRARCGFESEGVKRQTKAYVSEEVLDYFVYSAASFIKAERVTIDTTFTSGNFTCSVYNYDKNGLHWRFVEATYNYESGALGTSNDGDYEEGLANQVVSAGTDPATIILQGFNFTILILVAVALAFIVYRLDILMRMVKRRRARKKTKIDMTANPLQGSDSDASQSASETDFAALPRDARRRTSNYSLPLVSSSSGGTAKRRTSTVSSELFSAATVKGPARRASAAVSSRTEPSKTQSGLPTPDGMMLSSDDPIDSSAEKGEAITIRTI